MTNPQQIDPAAFAAFMAQQQAQAQAPAAQFPAQQPGYPTQQPMPQPQGFVQQPGYPMPPQGYAPQMPQGYGQVPQQPAAPPINASLEDFFDQPSTGWGPAWSWKGTPVGTTYVGIVARPVTKADIQQQTSPGANSQPLFYNDGRPKLVMRVPMHVQPTAQAPEGKAQWYVQGATRDELARAMAEVGAPAGPPEVGAAIAVTLSGERPNSFGNMTKIYSVKYQRPQGAAPAPAAAPAAPAPAPVDPALSQIAQQAAQPTPQVPAQAQAPVAQPAPVAPLAPVAQPTPPAPAASVEGLSPEQMQLLASLTNPAS